MNWNIIREGGGGKRRGLRGVTSPRVFCILRREAPVRKKIRDQLGVGQKRNRSNPPTQKKTEEKGFKEHREKELGP